MTKFMIAVLLAGLLMPVSVTMQAKSVNDCQEEAARHRKWTEADYRKCLGGPSSHWQYDIIQDKITESNGKLASLVSENSINFGFPYGEEKMHLLIRKQKLDGLSVLISLPKGQLICDISRGCPIRVKFDGVPVISFTGRIPGDYSHDALFLSPATKFIDSLKKSKTAVIEVVFYNHGIVQYEFQTAGFDWR